MFIRVAKVEWLDEIEEWKMIQKIARYGQTSQYAPSSHPADGFCSWYFLNNIEHEPVFEIYQRRTNLKSVFRQGELYILHISAASQYNQPDATISKSRTACYMPHCLFEQGELIKIRVVFNR
eukprot:293246-Hanusia_phi.AAC.1